MITRYFIEDTKKDYFVVNDSSCTTFYIIYTDLPHENKFGIETKTYRPISFQSRKREISKKNYYKFLRIINISYSLLRKADNSEKSNLFSLKEGEVFYNSNNQTYYRNHRKSIDDKIRVNREKICICHESFYYSLWDYDNDNNIISSKDDRKYIKNLFETTWDYLDNTLSSLMKELEKWKDMCDKQ